MKGLKSEKSERKSLAHSAMPASKIKREDLFFYSVKTKVGTLGFIKSLNVQMIKKTVSESAMEKKGKILVSDFERPLRSIRGKSFNPRKHLSRESKTKAFKSLKEFMKTENVGIEDDTEEPEPESKDYRGKRKVAVECVNSSPRKIKRLKVEIGEECVCTLCQHGHGYHNHPPQLSPIKFGVSSGLNSPSSQRSHPPVLSPAMSPRNHATALASSKPSCTKSHEREEIQNISPVKNSSPNTGSKIMIFRGNGELKINEDNNKTTCPLRDNVEILKRKFLHNPKQPEPEQMKIINEPFNFHNLKTWKTLAAINSERKSNPERSTQSEGKEISAVTGRKKESHKDILNKEPVNWVASCSMRSDVTDFSEDVNLILESQHHTTQENEKVITHLLVNPEKHEHEFKTAENVAVVKPHQQEIVTEGETGNDADGTHNAVREREGTSCETQMALMAATEGTTQLNSNSIPQSVGNGPVDVPQFNCVEDRDFTNVSQASPTGKLVNNYVEIMLSSQDLQDFEKAEVKLEKISEKLSIKEPNNNDEGADFRIDATRINLRRSKSPEVIDLVSDSEMDEEVTECTPNNVGKNSEENEGVLGKGDEDRRVGSTEESVSAPPETNDSCNSKRESVKQAKRQWAAPVKLRKGLNKLAKKRFCRKPKSLVRKRHKSAPIMSKLFSMLIIHKYKKERKEWQVLFGRKYEAKTPFSVRSTDGTQNESSDSTKSLDLISGQTNDNSTSEGPTLPAELDRPDSALGSGGGLCSISTEDNDGAASNSVDETERTRPICGNPAELFRKRRAELMRKSFEMRSETELDITPKTAQDGLSSSLPVDPDDCIKKILNGDLKYVKNSGGSNSQVEETRLVLHYEHDWHTREVSNENRPMANHATLKNKNEKLIRSVVSTMHRLCQCYKCGLVYDCPKRASECLRKHGYKQCWLCPNGKAPLSIKGKGFLDHNFNLHPDMKCRFCEEQLSTSIKLRQHFETVHFQLQEDQWSKEDDMPNTDALQGRIQNESQTILDETRNQSQTDAHGWQIAGSPNADELQTPPKAVYVSVIVRPKRLNESLLKDQGNSLVLKEAPLVINRSPAEPVIPDSSRTSQAINQYKESSTTFHRTTQTQVATDPVPTLARQSQSTAAGMPQLPAVWSPCFQRPAHNAFPGYSNNYCPATGFGQQGHNRPAVTPQSRIIPPPPSSYLHLMPPPPYPGVGSAPYPTTLLRENERRPTHVQQQGEIPGLSFCQNPPGLISPKVELAGILYCSGWTGQRNVLNFPIISCATFHWYNNLSPVERLDFDRLYKKKQIEANTYQFLKHCTEAPQLIRLDNNQSQFMQVWDCVSCLNTWFRWLHDSYIGASRSQPRQ